jgi:hypothetical protein
MSICHDSKRKCVLCNYSYVDNLSWGAEVIHHDKLVVCWHCRKSHKPDHIPDDQYAKFWIAFSKKWREENKDVKEEDGKIESSSTE